MTNENLKLALQLNNKKINDEINSIISYLNQFATQQKILHENIDNSIASINSNISSINSTLLYKISLVSTQLNDTSILLSNNLDNHINNTTVHVTQEDKDKWNSIANYTDGTVKSHAENLVIHVTQADKDLWNATLQNAKDYAKGLFDQVTSFKIVKCQSLPTEDIEEMTIYFLQIDPEQDDLYEEYMYIDNDWEKIGNTRIDLSDYVTNTQLQSAIDTINNTITTKETAINNTITTKETAINNAIAALETKHDNEIQTLSDAIDDLNNDLTSLDTDINDLIQEKVDEINQAIQDLEDKHDQDIEDINTNLTNNYQPKLHEHSNKSILDKLSIDANDKLLYDGNLVCDLTGFALSSDLDDYALKTDLHTHTNKAILDKFTLDANNNLLFDGNPIIDTTGYITSSDVASAISSALLNYVTDTNLTNTLNNYALKSEIPTVPDLSGYALKTEIPTIPDLSNYALKTDLHEHDNDTVLDKLSEDSNGNLLYDNKKMSVSISEEEDNALTELEDGLYVAPSNNGENYSNQESLSGKWTDDDDIYKITKSFTLNSNNIQTVAHNIIDIGNIIYCHAYIIHNDSYINLNYYDGTNLVYYKINDTNIIINKNTSEFDNDTLYIYIKYTKNTMPEGYSGYMLSNNQKLLTNDNKEFVVKEN